MFRFHKPINVLTLFHAPTSPTSVKILSMLRQAADAKPFDLDVVSAPTVPTPSQLTSILEYVGKDRVGEVVRGAKSEIEAAKLLQEGVEAGGGGTSAGAGASERVLRPLLVDWNNGKAVLGADEAAVRGLLDMLPKS